jgi:AsmA protein
MARHTRRLLNGFLWACGALAVVLLLAIAALLWWVDPDQYRGRVETSLGEMLGRAVTLDGALRWHIGAWITLESSGGTIANAPGFDAEPLAQWQRLRVGIATRPLLREELIVDRIELDGLRLHLQRNAQGAGNWMLGARTPAKPQAGASHPPQIGAIRMRNSAVDFHDATGNRWALDAFSAAVELPESLSTSRLALRAVQIDGRLTGGPLPPAGVPVSVAMPVVQIAISASPQFAWQSVALPAYSLTWGAAALRGNVTIRNAVQTQVHGALVLHTPSLRDSLATAGIAAPATRDARAFGAVQLAADFALQNGALDLGAIKLDFDGAQFAGSASLPAFAPLALRFDITADRLDLDRYLPPPDAPGTPLVLPRAQLKALDAKGTLRIHRATVNGAVARDLRIDVE